MGNRKRVIRKKNTLDAGKRSLVACSLVKSGGCETTEPLVSGGDSKEEL